MPTGSLAEGSPRGGGGPSRSTGVGRDDPRYKAARARFRAECAGRNAACWLCSQPIDYTLRHRPGRPIHPGTWELDHYREWAKYPALRLEPSNFRPSHMKCNRDRNNETGPRHTNGAPLGLGTPSRTW